MQAQEFLGACGVGVDVVEGAHEERVAEWARADAADDVGVQRGGAEDDEFWDMDVWVGEAEVGQRGDDGVDGVLVYACVWVVLVGAKGEEDGVDKDWGC